MGRKLVLHTTESEATMARRKMGRMTEVGQHARQGDVLLERVDATAVTPEHKAEPRDPHGRVVLALGEASGHAHVLRAPGVCCLRREGTGDRVLTVEDDVDLLHDMGGAAYVPTKEHSAIPVDGGGTYVVEPQRVWQGQGVRRAND